MRSCGHVGCGLGRAVGYVRVFADVKPSSGVELEGSGPAELRSYRVSM